MVGRGNIGGGSWKGSRRPHGRPSSGPTSRCRALTGARGATSISTTRRARRRWPACCRGAGLPAVVQQRAPRQRLQVAARDRGLRGRARGRGRVRRGARRHRRARAQHDRGDQRPGRRAAGGRARAQHRGRAPRQHAAVAPPRRGGAAGPQQRLGARGALRARAATARPRIDLVAVTGASNVTGEVWPLPELAAVAHHYGAELFVDAAQLAPHRAIDMAATGHRLPRAVRAQALRAVRVRRARRLRPRPRARRAADAWRRGDRDRHARRRHLGRRTRALRGRLAQRGGRRCARCRLPDPGRGRDGAHRGARARPVRAPGGGAGERPRPAAGRALERPPGRSRRPGDVHPRGLPPSPAGRDPERRACDRGAPRMLLRTSAARAPARRALARARSPRGADAGRRPARAPRRRARELRPGHHARRTSTGWSTPWPRSRAAARAGATSTTARTTSTGRHPRCARCRGCLATSRPPPARRRGR